MDYVTLEGKRATQKRGRLIQAFRPVAIRWLRLFGPEDAAEITLRLIQNHILMNTDLISVEAGVHWFKMLNKLLPWCPSRKYLEDAPATVPAPRELTEFELCTAVLASQNKHVAAAYNASHGTKFAVSLDSLSRLLKQVELAVRSNRQLLDEVMRRAVDAGSNKKGRGGDATGRIPRKERKAKDQGREDGEVRTRPSGKKECELCAKWKPRKKKHWTSECRVYNPDGFPKPTRRNGDGGRDKGKNNKRYSNAIAELSQLKKKYKNQKKKYKKTRRKGRRAGGAGYYSSSDSSDSDSE